MGCWLASCCSLRRQLRRVSLCVLADRCFELKVSSHHLSQLQLHRSLSIALAGKLHVLKYFNCLTMQTALEECRRHSCKKQFSHVSLIIFNLLPFIAKSRYSRTSSHRYKWLDATNNATKWMIRGNIKRGRNDSWFELRREIQKEFHGRSEKTISLVSIINFLSMKFDELT